MQQRSTVLDSIFDRNGNRRRSFSYNASQSTPYVVSGETFQYYTCCRNTNGTTRTMTLNDWRSSGVVWNWLTNPNALAPALRVDSVRASVSDWGGHWTITKHDKWGQIRELVDNNNVDTTTIYRTGLFPDSIRSPVGTVDRFGYDFFSGPERKLVWTKPENGDSTYLGYDSYGRVSSVSGPTQATQTMFRSGPDKVDSVVVGPYRTKFEYTTIGRVTKVTDPKDHVTETFYDGNFGNATKILYPGARFDSVQFDRYGRDSVVMNADAARQFILYDVINRVTRDSLSTDTSATAFGYNKEFLTRVLDPKGQVFKREVNELGWTRKVYDPADTTRYVRHEYTVEGLPALFVNARDQWLEMSYLGDYRHRVTAQGSQDTSFAPGTYRYGYRKDAPGQPNKRTGTFIAGENRESVDSIWMDLRGRVDSVVTRITANASSGIGSSLGQRRFVRRYIRNDLTHSLTVTVEARQAGTGALIRSFSPRSFNWNPNTGALTSAAIGTISTPGYGSIAFTKNAEGLDSVLTYSAGWPRNFNYTQRHEVYASTYANAGVDAALGRAYAYADTIKGQIAQMTWVNGTDNVLTEFHYDAHGRLGRMAQGTTATSNCSPPSGLDLELEGWSCNPQTTFTPSRVLGFDYDRARNLRKQVDSISSVADTAVNAAGNRLSSWGATSYTYDLDGNMTSRTDSSGTVNFVYGGDGLMRKVIAGSDTTCYEYNAFGQLAYRGRNCARNSQPGITQRRVERIFIWDGDHIIAETDSTATQRFAEYGYLPGIDRPFALVTDSVPGTGAIVRFFHQDELGNVIGLTRGNNIEQRIEYEPWGEVSSITGTVADTSRLRWKGLFWEGGNTSLYYARNRWYDPNARRFTSQDPIGLDGGLNQYTFGSNDPINSADPTGLSQCVTIVRHGNEGVVHTSGLTDVKYEGETWYETICWGGGGGKGSVDWASATKRWNEGGYEAVGQPNDAVTRARACAAKKLSFGITVIGDIAFVSGLYAAGKAAYTGIKYARGAALFGAATRYARTNRAAQMIKASRAAYTVAAADATAAVGGYATWGELQYSVAQTPDVGLADFIPVAASFDDYFDMKEACGS
jgi:RHS repeat-associated protein